MKVILRNSSIKFEVGAQVDANYFDNPIAGSSTGYRDQSAQLNTSFSTVGAWAYNSQNRGLVSAVIPVSVGDTIVFSGSKGSTACILNGYNRIDLTAGEGYGFVMNLAQWQEGETSGTKTVKITQEMVTAGVVCVRATAKNDGSQKIGKLV